MKNSKDKLRALSCRKNMIISLIGKLTRHSASKMKLIFYDTYSGVLHYEHMALGRVWEDRRTRLCHTVPGRWGSMSSSPIDGGLYLHEGIPTSLHPILWPAFLSYPKFRIVQKILLNITCNREKGLKPAWGHFMNKKDKKHVDLLILTQLWDFPNHSR